MEKIQIVEIEDPVYEETYIAHIQKNGATWIGWVPEVPKVKCEENTQKELLQTLIEKLHETLVAVDEAWEKQFEKDVKAGHLDDLRKEALADLRAGKCIDL